MKEVRFKKAPPSKEMMINPIAQPYLFMLKEGKGILSNPLDYSLMLLHVQHETLKSPKSVIK